MVDKNIFYSNGTSRLFISAQEDGSFISSILYYKKSLPDGKFEETILNFDVKSFLGKTEQEAQIIAEKWFGANIDKEFDVR